MKYYSLLASLKQLFKEIISLHLLINKDKDTSFLPPFFDERHQSLKLVIFIENLYRLVDVLTSLASVPYNNLHRRC